MILSSYVSTLQNLKVTLFHSNVALVGIIPHKPTANSAEHPLLGQ